MKLTVAAAIGQGRTELSAFDSALVAVGAANFNLVRLSSVIPPHSTVVEEGDAPLAGAVCADLPVCALVFCSYGSEPWSSR
jgi:arginine decarboxylase